VQVLLEADKEKAGISVPDGRGRLPVQQAVEHNAHAKLVQALVDAAPGQVQKLSSLQRAHVSALLESYSHRQAHREQFEKFPKKSIQRQATPFASGPASSPRTEEQLAWDASSTPRNTEEEVIPVSSREPNFSRDTSARAPDSAAESDTLPSASESMAYLTTDMLHIEISETGSKVQTKEEKLGGLHNAIKSYCTKQESFLLGSALSEPGKRLRKAGWSTRAKENKQ